MLLKDGVPYNERFGDVYFDANNPKAERQSVYASAIDEVKKDEIIIAESGFGFGLNFFVSLKKAQALGKKLHYIACEIEPISRADLQRFYADFSEFRELFCEFISFYYPIKDEILRIYFGDFGILDFYFGTAFAWLQNSDFRADIFYIDGFSPSKNAELFSTDFLALVKEHCAKNAILRSYSCARVFKDALSKNAFIYEKRAGHGKKREFIHALCPEPMAKKHTLNPWFAKARNSTLAKKPQNVVIIGAGITGLLTAYRLQELGISSVVLEKNPSLKNGASSNLAGLCLPLIHKPSSLLAKAHLRAFLAAVSFYKKHSELAPFISFCGAKYIAKNEDEKQRFKEAFLAYPTLFAKNGDEILVKRAVQIAPLALRQFLASRLDLRFGCEVEKIFDSDLRLKNGQKISFDALIIAGGAHSNELIKSYDKNILLSAVRGQATHIKPCYNGVPLSHKGYICAPFSSVQVIGSSFDRLDLDCEIRESENDENIAKVAQYLGKNVKVLGANAGLRAYSGDRFALISQMHDYQGFCEDYKALLWQKNKVQILPPPRYKKGIFVNTAHGAHALSTAVLGSEIMLDLLLNRPLCISHSLFSEFHSARFLIRKLKKGLEV